MYLFWKFGNKNFLQNNEEIQKGAPNTKFKHKDYVHIAMKYNFWKKSVFAFFTASKH